MKSLILLAAVVVCLTGCSAARSVLPGPGATPGDQLLSQSKQMKVLGKKLKHGQDLVAKGEKMLSRSEKLARDSQAAKLEAEGLIAQGNTLIQNSETDYEVAFGDDLTTSYR